MILGRIEAADYTGNDEDVQIVSELMDDVRDAVADYQVSCDPKPLLSAPHLGNRFRWRTIRSHMMRIVALL
jgi:hypothetical protein